eukprot:TRINITY_DN7307_c0_g1_i3.p1 TRINITY_DN7307_c0_g1~~TRINITY_DN7307_c0_g1_i3.p1  ORF type:complete len:190 (-),score=25.80 TRINITY_DN7307_c0_g1_i3:420-989(-)
MVTMVARILPCLHIPVLAVATWSCFDGECDEPVETTAFVQRSIQMTKVGDPDASTGLSGRPLLPCTSDNDTSVAGWTRSGSCDWDASDSGYHEVCVTMSDKFLQDSASQDNNDLSGVVQPGGHWCICAWAFASAVERDPQNIEGLQLVCDSTNSKLREVYLTHINLTSPSGLTYESKAALAKVNQLCPP